MGVAYEEYLDKLRLELSEEHEAELIRVRAELEAARCEVARQRHDATRWRQEAERLLRSTGQEVTA